MKVADVIRNSATDHVIYFLLNSYIGVARDCGRLKNLPEQVGDLSLSSKDELKLRVGMLMCELDVASKRLDDDKCIRIKEALVVFGTALYRLQSINGRQFQSGNLQSGTKAYSSPRRFS